MTVLRRAINAVLRMWQTHSDGDVMADIGEVVQEIDRQAPGSSDDIAEGRLIRAVRELPEQDRAILLAWKGGQTWRDIAKEFGLSEFVVLRTLSRAFAELRMKSVRQRTNN